MFVPRSGPLRSAFVELHLVDGPDGSFDVLHSHETFVQRQVVAHCVLFIWHGLVQGFSFVCLFLCGGVFDKSAIKRTGYFYLSIITTLLPNPQEIITARPLPIRFQLQNKQIRPSLRFGTFQVAALWRK